MAERIAFTYAGKELEGIVIQVKDGQATVKLDTGYNMLIPEGALQQAKQVPQKERPAHGHPPVRQDPGLPKVTILHTGGTIASKVDYATGATVAQFDPQELLSMFPELASLAHISSRLIRNMQSDDMRFGHYNLLASAVLEEIGKGATGVIITHGTDTLHHTGAALSFALEGLSIPVVLVGAQRSSDRGSSDAPTNLLGAVRWIREGHPGVYLAMHASSSDESIAILSGLHARKQHTSRRDAFTSVNAPVVARVHEKGVDILDPGRLLRLKGLAGTPRVMPFRESLKVGWWKAHPQSWAEELAPFEAFDGLLIEGTGLGHIPMTKVDELTGEHLRIIERVAALAKKMPVAIASQAIYGRVNLNVYSPQRQLKAAGVLGDQCDMHPETAFIKLAWLLSNYPAAEVGRLYGEDLRGEISARSPLEDSHHG